MRMAVGTLTRAASGQVRTKVRLEGVQKSVEEEVEAETIDYPFEKPGYKEGQRNGAVAHRE